MKKFLLTLLICMISGLSFASDIFIEGFEYANQDLTTPIGWTCDDQSWLCGYLENDHNRIPHRGNWYAFTDADDSWMFMELYFSSSLRYRPSYWAISDGSYEVEFWVGHEADPSQMTTLLFTATVSSGTYEQFSHYVELLPSNFEYFGIHAIASDGAYHLTIDDICIGMVDKYDLDVTPYEFHADMVPGDTITIEYVVQNTGYEDLEVFMTPYTDYFTDISFTVDGTDSNSFPTVPDQKVYCTCTTRLKPDITPGTTCWIDIMFTVSCDCVTRMATIWAVAMEPVGMEEHESEITLYPNPISDFVFIKAPGLQQVTVTDITGKQLINISAFCDDYCLDMTHLSAGVYFVTTKTSQNSYTHKLLKQ